MKYDAGHFYYDGSFNGFLTLIYDMEYNQLPLRTMKKEVNSKDMLFPDPLFIPTRPEDARQIWERLRLENYRALKTLYFAFMSEEKDIEDLLIGLYFDLKGSKASGSDIMAKSKYHSIIQLADHVEREKNSLERKLRIQVGQGSPSVIQIRPKYNILPLISRYFRTRYRENEWVIWDIRRKYGLHHLAGKVGFISHAPDRSGTSEIHSAEKYPSVERKWNTMAVNAVA